MFENPLFASSDLSISMMWIGESLILLSALGVAFFVGFDSLTKIRVSEYKRTSAVDKMILIVMLAMSYGLQMLILKMAFKQALVMNANLPQIVFSQLFNILFWVMFISTKKREGNNPYIKIIILCFYSIFLTANIVFQGASLYGYRIILIETDILVKILFVSFISTFIWCIDYDFTWTKKKPGLKYTIRNTLLWVSGFILPGITSYLFVFEVASHQEMRTSDIMTILVGTSIYIFVFFVFVGKLIFKPDLETKNVFIASRQIKNYRYAVYFTLIIMLMQYSCVVASKVFVIKSQELQATFTKIEQVLLNRGQYASIDGSGIQQVIDASFEDTCMPQRVGAISRCLITHEELLQKIRSSMNYPDNSKITQNDFLRVVNNLQYKNFSKLMNYLDLENRLLLASIFLATLVFLYTLFYSVKIGKKLNKFNRQLVNSIPFPIFVKNQSHDWLYANKAFYQFMNVDADQLLGHNEKKYFPPDQVTFFWSTDDYVIANGRSSSIESEITHLNGESITAIITKSPLTLENGATGLVGIIHDITEIKQYEHLLRMSNQFKQTILDSSKYGIVSTDEVGVIQTFNQAAELMLGYSAAEAIALLTPAIFLDPTEIVAEAKLLSDEMSMQINPGFEVIAAKSEDGDWDEKEWTFVNKNGMTFPVELSVSPLFRDSESEKNKNNIIGYLIIFNDITERKKIQMELNDHKDNLEALVNKQTAKIKETSANSELLLKITSMANSTRSVDDIIEYAIEHLCVYMGWSGGYYATTDANGSCHLGNYFLMANAEKRVMRVSSHMIDLQMKDLIILAANQSITAKDAVCILNDSKETAIIAIPIIIAEKPIGAIMFNAEVNETLSFETTGMIKMIGIHIGYVIERFKNESELMLAREKAESANQTKSEFLSNMSHELRTPMHAIINYANIGLKRLLKKEQDKIPVCFDNILLAANRLLALLNNLLDLAKLEEGKMTFEYHEHDFMEVLDHCLLEMDSIFKKKNITVSIIGEKEKYRAVFDKYKIIQVMINLLSNAVKFSPDNSCIHVNVERGKILTASDLVISVTDYGPGIPESELESIFDKFIQSSKTKSGAGGTGLGLAITRDIIHAHHGKIWASNNFDGGAKFTVVLPCDIKYS